MVAGRFGSWRVYLNDHDDNSSYQKELPPKIKSWLPRSTPIKFPFPVEDDPTTITILREDPLGIPISVGGVPVSGTRRCVTA
jgi:hypothetical protein